MRVVWASILAIYFLFQAVPDADAAPAAGRSVVVPPVPTDAQDEYHPGALRRRGGFRSGRVGYTDGTRGGVTPGRTGRAPGATTPAAPRSRFGGFMGGLFGGLLAGSLLGHLLNPFGFGGAGISLIGLLFWGVILYLIFRLFRGRTGTGGQGP